MGFFLLIWEEKVHQRPDWKIWNKKIVLASCWIFLFFVNHQLKLKFILKNSEKKLPNTEIWLHGGAQISMSFFWVLIWDEIVLKSIK